MVLSTSTVVQRLFSISRCGMTHLIKDFSGILQIPHKSPLIKTKPWTAMKRITRQKQYFQVRSHFKLNLLHVSLSEKKIYTITIYTCWNPEKTTGRRNELYLALHQQISNTSTSCWLLHCVQLYPSEAQSVRTMSGLLRRNIMEQ